MVDNLKEKRGKGARTAKGGDMEQKGFILIEVLIAVAILGIIAAVIIPNIPHLLNGGTNETAVTNQTIFELLKGQPITSLNSTALQFMVDYCLTADSQSPALDVWLGRAAVYQNQIIINELKEQR